MQAPVRHEGVYEPAANAACMQSRLAQQFLQHRKAWGKFCPNKNCEKSKKACERAAKLAIQHLAPISNQCLHEHLQVRVLIQ